MTPEEALAQAIKCGVAGWGKKVEVSALLAQSALAWVAIARELREQEAGKKPEPLSELRNVQRKGAIAATCPYCGHVWVPSVSTHVCERPKV